MEEGRRVTDQPGQEHAVGFVVIGRNEGDRLVRCLRSLVLTKAVIVYVDSGSTDGSVQAAKDLGAIIVELDAATPFTAARARNEGSKALISFRPKVEFVQFLDGDCELAPDWIAKATTAMADQPKVAVACGRRRERFPHASPYNLLCDIEWATPVGEAEACGGDALVRAEYFSAVGGFREALMAEEEPELCARLRANGWIILRIDAEMSLHDAAIHRFGQWWLRTVRAGYGFAQAWSVTRHGPYPLNGPKLRRAVAWAAALPLLIIVTAIFAPILAVFLGAVYLLQVARIAVRRGPTQRSSWIYAFFMVLSKFPELQGALKFLFNARGRAVRSSIEYK